MMSDEKVMHKCGSTMRLTMALQKLVDQEMAVRLWIHGMGVDAIARYTDMDEMNVTSIIRWYVQHEEKEENDDAHDE